MAAAAILLLASACQDGASVQNAIENVSCIESSRDAALNGLPLNRVLARLGTASSDEVYALSEEEITEFRIEILNQYPLPKEKGRRIRELQWTKGFCNTAIWFIEDGNGWTSFDNLTWNDDTLF